MELNIKNLSSSAISNEIIKISSDLFGCSFNKHLIHSVLTSYFNNGRAGTSSQKTRAEVSGSGKKPWRQKGTGRARAGCFRSPIWRGGGIVFASKFRVYEKKINKKEYNFAMRSIFSELMRNDRLIIVDRFGKYLKTKEFIIDISKIIDIDKLNKVYVINDDIDKSFDMVSRNVNNIEVSDVKGLNPVSLVDSDFVVCTFSALKAIEKRLCEYE